MADQKVFAGPRVKRFRMGLELSQTAMAEELDISPSYLNLIERNQRPLTVQLILKLAKVYNISPDELQGDNDGTVSSLKNVFSDALLQGELPGYEELFDLADVAPNAANGILTLHQGYRKALERLSDLNAAMAKDGHEQGLTETALPNELVGQAMEERPNYYDALDRAAEIFSNELDKSLGLTAALQGWLASEKRIQVQTLPVETMPEWRRRFDKHSRRLFISDRLGPKGQTRELATEVALLALSYEIDGAVLRLALKSEDAKHLARLEFANYAAMAIIMPYQRFAQAAARMKYDVDALASRFNVSFEQAALRLTNLSRPKMEGIGFFFAKVDIAGNWVRRLGSHGFPRINFGGDCPKLQLYSAIGRANTLLVDHVVLKDGEDFITISKSIIPTVGAFGQEGRQTAVLLGCSAKEAEKTIYATKLMEEPRKVGLACRLCEIPNCSHRAAAPIARPLAVSESENSISEFNFKS